MKLRTPGLVFLLLLAAVASLGETPATRPAQKLYAMSSTQFWQLPAVRERIGDDLQRDLVEAAIFHATNDARRRLGLDPLGYSPALVGVARDHSQEMVKLQYFAHVSPVEANRTLKDRIGQAGFRYGLFAENLAVRPVWELGSGRYYLKNDDAGQPQRVDAKTGKVLHHATYAEWARDVVSDWMHSPEHRENIVNPKLTELGVGVARGNYKKQDALYATQNFAHVFTPQR